LDGVTDTSGMTIAARNENGQGKRPAVNSAWQKVNGLGAVVGSRKGSRSHR